MFIKMRSDNQAYKRYKSKKWRVFRKQFLDRNPLCKNFNECHRFAEHVDHIKRVEDEDDPLFYNESNLQALCKRCHSRKTAKEDGAFGNKKKDY